MWLTCFGRRCADGRSLLWNLSAWSLSVVPFRRSCVGGLGCNNRIALCGTIARDAIFFIPSMIAGTLAVID